MCTTKWASVVLIALQQLLTCMKYSYPHTRERVIISFWLQNSVLILKYFGNIWTKWRLRRLSAKYYDWCALTFIWRILINVIPSLKANIKAIRSGLIFRYHWRDYTEAATLSTDLTSRPNNALTEIFHLNIKLFE